MGVWAGQDGVDAVFGRKVGGLGARLAHVGYAARLLDRDRLTSRNTEQSDRNLAKQRGVQARCAGAR